MPLRAVFFDLGGTLFRYGDLRHAFDGFLSRLLTSHGVEAAPDDARQAYREAMGSAFAEFLPRPYYLHRELFETAHRELLAKLGATPAPDDGLGQLYEGQMELGLDTVRPRPNASQVLSTLRERGLSLAVVSNIDDDQFHPLWQNMGLDHLFDAITTSEEAHSCKPHRGIFDHALRKAPGVRPEEVLFVGDSPEHDVAGARPLGMRTALITDHASELPWEPRGDARPDHVIRDLAELIPLVDAP